MVDPLPPPDPPTSTSSLYVSPRIGPADQNAPDSVSSDYDAMYPYWKMVDTIVGGTAAMRAAGTTYLPRFPKEKLGDYNYRKNNAVFTNIYSDIISNLASKPFAEKLDLDDTAAEQFKTLSENIDGRGNNLHVFASETFYWGINHAINWILVDYPKVLRPANAPARPMTVAEERAQNLRPYWLHITAPRMLAVYSDSLNGQEIFVHARISEVTRQRRGFGEVSVHRIRIFNREPVLDEFGRPMAYAPATFEVWEKRSSVGRVQTNSEWVLVEDGPIGIGVIPLVPFITGRRIESSWAFNPPMRDAAYAQIEHFQAETSLKSIKELTAFPMLSGDGVSPPGKNEVPIEVGARSVIYAPPFNDAAGHGTWKYLEPNGTSLKFLADEIDRLEKQMRELGRQPLTAQSGNLTVVTTAFAAQKGNSAVQQWALGLKDALEQAWYLTALWLGQGELAPTVNVYTDFAVEMGDDKGPQILKEMRKSRDLSQLTYWEEMQRRNILSSDFDAEEEQKRLAEEEPPLPSPNDIKSAMLLGRPPPGSPPGTPPLKPPAEAANG